MKALQLAAVRSTLRKDISKRQAAIELGCGYSTLCKFCTTHGITRKLASRPAKYNAEAISTAVRSSRSFTEVCAQLQIPRQGGSLQRLKERIKLYNIDVSHLVQLSSTECLRRWQRKRKPYVIKQGVRENRKYLLTLMTNVEEQCAICKLVEWQGAPIKLHIDHIDGNHGHNVDTNLQYLCPNCHMQKTYPVLV